MLSLSVTSHLFHLPAPLIPPSPVLIYLNGFIVIGRAQLDLIVVEIVGYLSHSYNYGEEGKITTNLLRGEQVLWKKLTVRMHV